MLTDVFIVFPGFVSKGERVRMRPRRLNGQDLDPCRSPSSLEARRLFIANNFRERGRMDRRRARPPGRRGSQYAILASLSSAASAFQALGRLPSACLNVRLCRQGYFPVNHSTIVLRKTQTKCIPSSNCLSVHRPICPLLHLGGSARFKVRGRPQCPRPQTLELGRHLQEFSIC